ncbi:TonB-dependent receptor plug domain-containing protein [Marinobacter sp. SS21]|uniref:TonB-dependent receptor plug domain-containing protein n=1 Tax=Marinobacter sp. SS21 TaxID=2979460 RepID=UPI00232CB27A|nr:TonB-dependent receptor [Marinobacter sp. SS21]MDC0663482.1 TonB-dependent receptor [Marinobacter sp. SS21]
MTNSPAAISVYSAEEIALFGGRDLSEVLARIPGVNFYHDTGGHKFRVMTRADAPRLNNNHTLILLDGIPFNRESYTGGLWNHAVLTTLPLDAIRQIEVVRGPGSVLYGTNAFSGVINIVTKRAGQIENSVSLGGGSNTTFASTFTYAAEASDTETEFVTAWRHYRTEGERLRSNDSSGQFSARLEESSPGGLVTARHQGFHAAIQWGRAEMENIRGSDIQLADGGLDNERIFAAVGYERDIGSHWRAKVDLSHVSQRLELIEPTAGVLGPINYKTDDSRIELQLQGELSDNLQLVTGVTWDSFLARIEEPYPFLPNWRNNLYSAYAQAEYQWRETRFTGGLQFNKVEGIADKTVPRVGLIHNFTDTAGIKLMYAEAFRAPYALETDIKLITPAVSLLGNPELRRETVKTWDLQLFHDTPRLQSALTLFHSRQKDLIVRRLQSPGVISTFNDAELEIQGVELETKYIPHANWFLSGSATWQQNKDNNGTRDTTLQPDYVIKAGIGYRANTWSLGLFDIYQSRYQDNVIVTPSRRTLNPAANASHNLSLNGTLELVQLNRLELGLYVHNLLDEDFWLPPVPGFTTSNQNTQPSVESGRTYLITAKLPF